MIKLNKSADLELRIATITILQRKAEDKVIHADTFRQRNMNFALASFAAMIGLRVNTDDAMSQMVISIALIMLCIVFCAWDRRWHRVKHGWDSTAKLCYKCVIQLTNDPDQDVEFTAYDSLAEERAEWRSLQPMVFYVLVIGAVGSFFVS